jgi:hypothetical protein
MKRFFLILAAVGLTGLSACSNLEVQADPGTQKKIGLAAFTNLTTKSVGAIDGTTLPTDFGMRVSAYHNAASGQGSSQTYFTGIKFANSSSNIWSEHKYWPLNGTLAILAYANRTMDAESDGDLVSNAAWTNTSAANSVVLTVGDNSTRYDDLVYGGNTAAVWASEGTPITFKHAFAVVMFTFKSSTTTYDGTNNYGITVNSVTVNNAYYGGTLTITNGGEPSATWGSTLTNQQTAVTARNYTSNAAMAAINLTGTASTASFGDAYVILPQQAATSFTINYTLHNGKDASNNNLNINMVYNANFASTTWEMGKKYVYAVDFQPREIQIAATVENWTAPSSAPAGISIQ